MTTGTELPPPNQLPEIHADPAVLRQLAEAQVNVELDTGDMILNLGPQHPATHGTLRLVVRLDGERVIAPTCNPISPRNNRNVAIRESSVSTVRMYWARGGASMPISISAPEMNGTSFANDDSQSIRLISVVICGYVRNSVSFS